MSEPNQFHVAGKSISCRRNDFMSPNVDSCRRENDFMSPTKFHVAEKMISCRENDFMSPKLISCRQKCFSCRRKVDFMSLKKFHVAEKVDFPDVIGPPTSS